MSALPKTAAFSLTGHIVARLADDILSGVYVPGERLKEQEIALCFGISRAHLREALRLLEGNGLIEILTCQGAGLIQLSSVEISELFDDRADIFALCACHEYIKGKSEKIDLLSYEILKLIEQTEAGCDERDYKAQTDHIHKMMVASIDNPYVRCIMDNLRQKMLWLYCYLGTSSIERRRDANNLWNHLLQTLHRRDEHPAEKIAQMSMTASKEFAMKLLDCRL